MTSGLWADVRYAVRLLARSPGFTLAAVTALALAIGANVTVFTLANAFLFKNLPFDDSGRILYVSSRNPARPGTRGVSYPDFLDYREQVPSFEQVAAFTSGSLDLSDGAGFPERYRYAFLTSGAFAAIGQRPLRGRDFLPDDERPGAPPVAIVSYTLWQNRYGSDPAAVGKAVRINDAPATIVGVMGKGVTFPGASDVWMPLVRTPAMQRRDSRTLTVFGRLRPHGSERSARSEMAVIAHRLAEAYPATNKDIGVVVQNFNDRFNGGETARLLFWLLWAVGFVLLIACANIANLLLARAVGRSREVSIRASLGASRWRVVRQLLAESLLLASLGAAFGWMLGIWGVGVFDSALVPAVKPAYIDFAVDWRVIAYLAAITVATAVLFGLAPALQLSRIDLNAALKQGGGVTGLSRGARLFSAGLVIAEVSLAVILLAAAGLMVRSLVNTSRAEIGVRAENVLSMEISLRRAKYPRPEDHVQFFERLKERIEALPGVDASTAASDLPAESPDMFGYEAEGAAPVQARERAQSAGLVVGEDYFRAMGVGLKSGREFQRTDTAAAPPVVIVNEAFVRQAWPGQEAVGKRLRITGDEDTPRDAPVVPGPWLTVVAVAPDILQDDEAFELSPVLYLPMRQRPQSGAEFMVRTRVPPATMADAIRREVQALDADLAVRSLRPLEQSLWFRNWRHRIFGTMFAIFGGIALVLASVGLYAVIAHSVSQRTKEIGVRLSLGATPRGILTLVFTEGMSRFAIGLVLGLGGAVAATGVLESMLVGVSAVDPMTLAGVSLVLGLAGGLGCALPARRAMRVDPVIALRHE